MTKKVKRITTNFDPVDYEDLDYPARTVLGFIAIFHKEEDPDFELDSDRIKKYLPFYDVDVILDYLKREKFIEIE